MMPTFQYHCSLYIESGEIEGDDAADAQAVAEEYVREQFSDALSQADWTIELVSDPKHANGGNGA